MYKGSLKDTLKMIDSEKYCLTFLTQIMDMHHVHTQTHVTVHLPYSLSQPYDGKFSGFPMLTARSVISSSGLDNTGSPDSWHIHYKKCYLV